MVDDTHREKLLMGNEACVEGGLAAGVRFFAAYPITPANEIGEIFSERLPEIGGKFIQMEDEIASIGAIIGASIGGVKSMTATSGPGFSLMQEHVGFAAIAETPCVVVNVMRGGPSTGLPTRPSQGDVMQARWGTHGDHPIIVLCPHSVRETFDLTIVAVNFSEKYRVPVILLMDEVIGHMREKMKLPRPESIEIIDRIKPDVPPDWYKPFEDNKTGVPPMANFGEGYRYHITGLTHDVMGFPTSKPDEIKACIERLFRKITLGLKDIQLWEQVMTDDAEVVIVAYGCVARTAKQVVMELRKKGVKVGLLRLITIWPFPRRAFEPLTKKGKKLLVPEMNMGQIYREVLRVNEGRAEVVKVSRIDGELITPQEIVDAL
ncbi:MAG: 2-oxoacid:acceptor oxidoreductase subunit alpha [Deltaproteobacteria bacterium]|nr:2-oxoacid:acceptor oxidoreductase subunit alpha [Deltaproteobacteria bacterium]